jgi:segregation and condensation protein B
MTMNPTELKGALEAIIYAADEPATLDQIAKAIGDEKSAVSAALDEMIAAYATEDRGIEIRAVAGGYKFYTKPQHHEAVRRFIKSLRPPLRLTMPALETLAVIAYRGPATGPEIQEIRGVNVSGVIKTLLEKRLIVTAGRKTIMGRPIMYRTSKEFLMRFGLSDLEELPSLKEFEQLARAALGSDEGIAPIELEALEALNSEEIVEGESAVENEISSSSATTEGSASKTVVETFHAIETVDGTEGELTQETAAVSDTPDAMETVRVTETSEADAVSETIPQPRQETPEAAPADAEHSEEARAESAS